MKNKQLLFTFLLIGFIGVFNITAQDSYTDNKDINSLLEKKREFNKSNGYGYRIQLYNGLEKRARSFKGRFEVEFSGVYTRLKYDAPEWKIHVGNYKTRLEADKALNKIKEKFSGAIVIPL